MIKFFRRIRYDLMEKIPPERGSQASKTGKPTFAAGRYLKYAIGEIILVVIGILIALSINTWNETRKQVIAEKEIINGIKKDLTEDKKYIQLVIKLAQKKDSIYTVLSNDLFMLYDTDRPVLDSLLRDYFAAQRTFYPISGSFESAISGNEISKFNNKSFSAAATKLYNSTYARLIDNGEDSDEKWFFLTKKYSEIRRTGHLPEMSKTQLNEFLNDVFYHMFGLNHYRNNLSNTIVEIDMLLLEH